MLTPGYSVVLNSIVVWLIVINPLSKYPLTLTPINLSVELEFLKLPLAYQLLSFKIGRFFYIIISRTLLSFVIISTAILLPEFDRAMVSFGFFVFL